MLLFFTNHSKILLVILIVFVTNSCEKSIKENNSPVLAIVENNKITQADLEYHINNKFSQASTILQDESAKQKILESLVASKAMAYLAKKTLPEKNQKLIEQNVAAFKEQAYVKEYLKDRVSPKTITSSMIRDYYDKHPEKFGGEQKKTVEWLSIPIKSNEEQRTRFFNMKKTLKENDSWSSLEKQFQEQSITYRVLELLNTNSILETELNSAINELGKGEISEIIFTDEHVSLLKIKNIKILPIKPLNEVSADIRKILAPVHLKESVKHVSQSAIEEVNINYK